MFNSLHGTAHYARFTASLSNDKVRAVDFPHCFSPTNKLSTGSTTDILERLPDPTQLSIFFKKNNATLSYRIAFVFAMYRLPAIFYCFV